MKTVYTVRKNRATIVTDISKRTKMQTRGVNSSKLHSRDFGKQISLAGQRRTLRGFSQSGLLLQVSCTREKKKETRMPALDGRRWPREVRKPSKRSLASICPSTVFCRRQCVRCNERSGRARRKLISKHVYPTLILDLPTENVYT